MRRRKRVGIASGVTLPVTPMLDMTFQLLFFLILSFRSGAEERQFEAGAPSSAGVGPTGQGVEDTPAKLTVAVRALPDGTGGISGLTVQSFEGEWVMADLAALTQFLRPRRGDLDKPAPIRIKADQRLKYSRVMDVIDACGQAGFKQVGFAAPDW